MTCPVCGSEQLWGPAEVIDDEGTVHEYVDCARCHTLCPWEDWAAHHRRPQPYPVQPGLRQPHRATARAAESSLRGNGQRPVTPEDAAT